MTNDGNDNNILYSKYNDLSKIYDLNSNKLILTIPSPNHYFDCEKKRIIHPIYQYSKYSILGLNDNNDDDNKSHLIKLNSGIIALKIPFMKLFKFYMEKT